MEDWATANFPAWIIGVGVKLGLLIKANNTDWGWRLQRSPEEMYRRLGRK